jgi:large subunit ribosomal protein L34
MNRTLVRLFHQVSGSSNLIKSFNFLPFQSKQLLFENVLPSYNPLIDISYNEPSGTNTLDMELHGGVRRSVIKKKRTHGFLQRMASTGGRRVLRLRRNKGRKFLTV